MSKRRSLNVSDEEKARTKAMREQVRAWRQHPNDPWAELERLGISEDVGRLGWSQTRVSRAMNSVASEEKFRLKVHRALLDANDRPLYLAAGIGKAGTTEEDHGYTRNAGKALDADAEIIDLPTRSRLEKESAARRAEHVGELIAACEEVRAALDERVQRNPAFMSMAGRHVWLVRSKIDAMLRDLRRKAA